MTIDEGLEAVNAGAPEVSLDFSTVSRIDGAMVAGLEQLADRAKERSAGVVLHGVNSDVYRVLKQLKLAERFGFVN